MEQLQVFEMTAELDAHNADDDGNDEVVENDEHEKKTKSSSKRQNHLTGKALPCFRKKHNSYECST
jgi:hypothetical protein